MRLGGRLANFTLRPNTASKSTATAGQVIEFNTEENFRQLAPFVGNLVEKERFDFVMESSRGFFRDHGGLFQRRVAEGRICDGHGDLRAEHVYFLDQIQIIDCI